MTYKLAHVVRGEESLFLEKLFLHSNAVAEKKSDESDEIIISPKEETEKFFTDFAKEVGIDDSSNRYGSLKFGEWASFKYGVGTTQQFKGFLSKAEKAAEEAKRPAPKDFHPPSDHLTLKKVTHGRSTTVTHLPAIFAALVRKHFSEFLLPSREDSKAAPEDDTILVKKFLSKVAPDSEHNEITQRMVTDYEGENSFLKCLFRCSAFCAAPASHISAFLKDIVLVHPYGIRTALEYSEIMKHHAAKNSDYERYSKEFSQAAVAMLSKLPNDMQRSWVLEQVAPYMKLSCLDFALEKVNMEFASSSLVTAICTRWWHGQLQSAYTKAREEDEALDLKTFSGKLGIDWNNVPFLCLVKRILDGESVVTVPKYRFELYRASLVTLTYFVSDIDFRGANEPLTWFELFSGTMAIGFISDEFSQLIAQKMDYFKSLWNYCDFLIVLLSVVAMISRKWYAVFGIDDASTSTINEDIYRVSSSILMLTLWLRCLQLTVFYESAAILQISFRQMLPKVFIFLCLIVSIWLGFTFCFAHVVAHLDDANSDAFLPECPADSAVVPNPENICLPPQWQNWQNILYLHMKAGFGYSADFATLDQIPLANANAYAPIVGYISVFFEIFYLVCANIVLVNLLISMLGGAHGDVTEQGAMRARFSQLLVMREFDGRGHKLPTPLNMIVFLAWLPILCAVRCAHLKKSSGSKLKTSYCPHCHHMLKTNTLTGDWERGKLENFLKSAYLYRQHEDNKDNKDVGHFNQVVESFVRNNVCPGDKYSYISSYIDRHPIPESEFLHTADVDSIPNNSFCDKLKQNKPAECLRYIDVSDPNKLMGYSSKVLGNIEAFVFFCFVEFPILVVYCTLNLVIFQLIVKPMFALFLADTWNCCCCRKPSVKKNLPSPTACCKDLFNEILPPRNSDNVLPGQGLNRKLAAKNQWRYDTLVHFPDTSGVTSLMQCHLDLDLKTCDGEQKIVSRLRSADSLLEAIGYRSKQYFPTTDFSQLEIARKCSTTWKNMSECIDKLFPTLAS